MASSLRLLEKPDTPDITPDSLSNLRTAVPQAGDIRPTGINVIKLVSDHGPNKISELNEEIAKYEGKVTELKLQREYVVKLVNVVEQYPLDSQRKSF